MKKSTLLFSLSLGSLGVIALSAQPTLTSSGMTPVVGNSMTLNNTAYVSPGTAGANQTWNLSSMSSTGSNVYTGVAPSSTPNGASFSAATVALGSSGIYVYYKGTASALQYYGVDNGSTTMPYSNPEDQLHFPFTFNNTYTDTWATTFTNTYTFYRTGSTVVTADGYGTLTTPDGTFSNVLRVHFVQTYQDSAYIANMAYIITYQNDEYMWYLNNNHYPIAAVYTLTTSAGGPTQGGLYMSNVVSGVNENNLLLSQTLAPNPSNDHVDFTFGLAASQNVQLEIYTSTGQLAEAPEMMAGVAGENTVRIDVAELPAGMYFMKVLLDGVPAGTERFVISR